MSTKNSVQLTKGGVPIFPITDVSLITGIEERTGMRLIPVDSLPTASADTAGFIYMVKSTGDLSVTEATGGSYAWVPAGNVASLNLDGYATEEELSQLGQEVTDIQEELPNKANVDGVYETLVSGGALSLVAKTTVESEFTFDQIPAAAADGPVLPKMVKGKSLVWNQLASRNFTAHTHNGVTFTADTTRNSIKLSGTTSDSYAASTNIVSTAFIVGHKYYYSHNVVSNPNELNTIQYGLLQQANVGGESAQPLYRAILAPTATGKNWGIEVSSGTDVTGIEVVINIVDLTLMFGAGNEPTTVAEFEKLFPLPYYDYNAGNIKNNMTTAVKFTGFNQWDEEWEHCYWDEGDGGVKKSYSESLGSKSYIPVFPNTLYYMTSPNITFFKLFYDADKNLISYTTADPRFTTPANCAYLTFYAMGYPADYAHDICINISDANRNGEYEPHKETIVQLDLTTKTGKLNGEGSSVTVFPDGMRSAGTAYDEMVVENGYVTKIIKRIGSVDMGTLTWSTSPDNGFTTTDTDEIPIHQMSATHQTLLCAKFVTIYANSKGNIYGTGYYINVPEVSDTYADAATFKAAMSGVMLNYELATPETYLLDTPIPISFQAYKGGTMMQLPQNGSAPTTAPMVMLAQYPMDAAGAINYILQVLANNNLS